MNTKHTPGPWRLSTITPLSINTSQGAMSRAIAEAVTGEAMSDIFVERKEAEANARLIAAAPELLAALRTIHEAALRISTGGSLLDDKGFNTLAHPVSVAEAAIAKATTPNT